MASKRGTWIAGAAVLAVGAMAGTWFVGIGPTLSAAADVRAQTEATQQQNEVLRAKLVTLKEDFANLPGYRADLAALQVGIPTDVELSSYLDQLDAFAATYGVTVIDVTPQAPQLIGSAADGASAAAAPAPTDSASTDGSTAAPTAPAADSAAAGSTESAGAGAVDPASTALPAGAAGLVAVPVSFTVLGPFPAAVAFLHDVQESSGRLLLVGGITGLGQDEAEAAQGKPATHRGDMELEVSGLLYVLPSTTAGTDVEADPSGELPRGDVAGDPVAPKG